MAKDMQGADATAPFPKVTVDDGMNQKPATGSGPNDEVKPMFPSAKVSSVGPVPPTMSDKADDQPPKR